MKLKSGFYISPEGKVVKLKGSPDDWISIHGGIATEITGDDSGKATDTLYNRGWIAMFGIRGYHAKNEPTQAQLNTLYKLGYEQIIQDITKPKK